MGIVLFFYSKEHLPIHVHAQIAEFESKAEFILTNGKIEAVRITNVRGKNPLEGKHLKNFKSFLTTYADEVVEKWVDYFVYQKTIKFERISKKLK